MSDYFDRIEQQLVQRVEAGAAREYRLRVPWGGLAAAAVVLVVVAVAGAFLLTLRSGPAQQVGSRPFAGSSVTLSPPHGTPVATVDRVVSILRQRAAAVLPGAEVSREGAQIAIKAPRTPDARAQILALAAPGRLEFYDWEANALLPSGKTVASQLHAQDPTASQISQGGHGAPPGEPGAGSLSLYQAVVLAAKQPYQPADDNSRITPQYFLFGTPGSGGCTTAARDAGTVATPGEHCLLSGPADTLRDLYAGVATGVSASQGQLLTIKRGTVVLQAANTSAKQQIQLSSPKAQFYVLKDHVALSGEDVTNPRPSTDQGGNSAVSFGFTPHGKTAFQKITSDIAHRAQLNSALGPPQNQHFAVALDNQLITVPQIDFKQYPDGISGTNGADVVGNLAPQTAKTLATILRFGPLPVAITATR